MRFIVLLALIVLFDIDGKTAIPVKQLEEILRESSKETKEIMLPAPVEIWTPRMLNL